MMLKLLKSYNLLFLLIALLLLGSTSLYAQQGNVSGFSIYGDVYSGVPVQSLLSDDWFQGTTGNGMIDEDPTQVANFTTWTQAQRNEGFTARSPYNQYKVLNDFLLYDAVYGRDHVNFGSDIGGQDKSAFRGSSGKYVDDPQSTWDLGTDVPVGNSVDLVDVYAHLRRGGVSIDSNMWLMLGASTFATNGDYYVDFELYASPIALSADRTKFVNSGPTNKGGHTPWEFDSNGEVTSSGDMLAGFKFSTNAVSDVELKIWVSKSTAANINPARFNFVPGSYHEGTKAYGYINIVVPSANVRSSGVPLGGVTGPPWGTFKDGPGDKYVTKYEMGALAEVGINLSSLGIDPSLATGNPCDAPFTKLLVKTKSSNSLSATLKDFAGPYNFLGASKVDVTIKKSTPVFNCSNSIIGLSPESPQPGAYYVWNTIDGLFSNGTKQVIGQNATAVQPGSYTLAAAPLVGCTQQTNTIRIYAAPCAYDDAAEVVENNGSVVINVLANDVDLDNDIVPSKTVINTGLLKRPDNGTFSINSSGIITYTPNPDFYGIDTFEYRVVDNTPTPTPHFGPYSDLGLVTVNVLRDSDNDKVPDRDDLDDDNDGIPDTIELQCVPLNNPNLVKDGDFEDNDVAYLETLTYYNGTDWVDVDEASSDGVWKGPDSYIPNWTSAGVGANKDLELWKNGNENIDWTTGYGSFSGQQFVEVDASSPLGLFQDIPTTPGKVLRWSFAHRNRFSSGDDDIELVMGAPTGVLSSQGIFRSAPNYAWKENVGYYTVPAGQTFTRVWFKAIVGSNFIDNVKVYVFDQCYDFDGDEIPNHLDLDSDNDGIPDIREAGLPDADNNGLVDTNVFGTNGLADIVETDPDNGVLNYEVRNTDLATDNNPLIILYDFLDLDSDNDGITDAKEAFSKSSLFKDAANDGRIDGFKDVDKNGWHDAISAPTLGAFPTLLNSDADLLPNYLDLDSDGDGIPDTLESNRGVPDADNDGVVGEGIPADVDGDGLANSNDPDFFGNVVGGADFLQDFDNDGLPNHLDIDSDNDGIIDNIEAQGTDSYNAPLSADTDNDGINDAYDVNIDPTYGIGYVNTDGASDPDYIDIDSENDLIFDILENNIDNDLDDSDSNGVLDSFTDTDGDGLADIFDLIPGTSNLLNATNNNQLPTTHPDLDPSGGDRDWREITEQDYDKDGIPDLVDLDDDNDGILDTIEDFNLDNDNDPRTDVSDTDGDGIPNYFDLDSDADGLTDTYEAGGVFDADGSGMPGTGILIYNADPTISQVGAEAGVDYGVPLQVTNSGGYTYGQVGLTPPDTDGDGIPNYLDLDSDSDGISDVIEAGGPDANGDGIYGSGAANDIDADGLADAVDPYDNSDLTVLGTPLTTIVNSYHQTVDTDGDGFPNNLDLDSDDDTIPDIVEAQTTLGYIAYNSTDSNSNGLKDVFDTRLGGTGIIPVDTDGDGIPDYLDLDSDDEGGFDIVEANAVPVTDANGDGRTDAAVGNNGLDDAFDNGDTYVDPNGKHDDTQFNNFPDNDADVLTGGDVDFRDATFSDNDKDLIADNVDLDDDNDGILDTVELNNKDPYADHDNDGIQNYKDPKFCSSGALNIKGICTEFDLDGDGILNHFDLDSDADGCSDALEAGTTTDVSAEFKFTGTVGTDGIPDEVQSSTGADSGLVDNTKNPVQTNSGVYDFLDAAIFVACKADLSLVKTVKKSGGSPSDNLNAQIGDVIVFTLTLTNDGPFSVQNPQVQDILPEGLINISGSTTSGSYDPTTGIWDLTDITLAPSGAGSIKELQITATIGPNCGTITNTAKVYYSNRADPDSTPTSNTKY